jgi:hypothetical protein
MVIARLIRVWYSDGRKEDNVIKPFFWNGRDFGEEHGCPRNVVAGFPSRSIGSPLTKSIGTVSITRLLEFYRQRL